MQLTPRKIKWQVFKRKTKSEVHGQDQKSNRVWFSHGSIKRLPTDG